MFDTRATDEILDLWMDGFNPATEGWTKLGPADTDDAVAWAWRCRERGIPVEVFLSPLGKLSFYAQGEREDVFQIEEATSGEIAGARPPVKRGAGAPA